MSKTIRLFLFLVVVVLLIWFNLDLKQLHLQKANSCFEKGDYICAQINYEKAFEFGEQDSDARNNYLETIFDSPIDVKALEKLEKFIEYKLDDSAQIRAEYFMYDLNREVNSKYPGNFILQAPTTGGVVRWGNRPITYGFNSSEKVPSYFIEEVKNAFEEWTDATNGEFEFVQKRENPNIVIEFLKHNPAEPDGKKYIVAYTNSVINSNRLNTMYIYFYLKGVNGEYFSPNQVYNTALHEIAHALGFMGHSHDKNNLLYATKDSEVVRNDERDSLTLADINTIKLLYKIKPDITNVEDLESKYTPYLILGSDKEIYNHKLKEALNYIKDSPNLPNGYIDAASCYMDMKNYKKAIIYLEKAAKFADRVDFEKIVYYNLAIAYMYDKNYDMAKKYVYKSFEIEDSQSVHHLLAEIYIRTEDYDAALSELNNLILKDPNNETYVITLVNFYIQLKDYNNARKVLNEYFTKFPQQKKNPKFAPYGNLLWLL